MKHKAATLSLWTAAACLLAIPVAIEVQYRNATQIVPMPPEPPPHATVIHVNPAPDWSMPHHDNDFSTTWVEPAGSTG